MKRIVTIASLLLLSVSIFAQQTTGGEKPALDHSVYDSWKSVTTVNRYNAGGWISYTIKPQEGDETLFIKNLFTGKEFVCERASRADLSQDGAFAVFSVKPAFQQTRQAKIDKKKPDQMPKDTLCVLNLATGEKQLYPFLDKTYLPLHINGFIAFSTNEPAADNPAAKAPADTSAKAPADSAAKAPAPQKPAKDNLYVLNLKTLAVDTLKSVENCFFAPEGNRLAYVTKPGPKDSLTTRGIFLFDPAAKADEKILTGEKKAVFGKAHFSDEGDRLLFFANLDTTDAAKDFSDLYLYKLAGKEVTKVADNRAKGLRKGWKVNEARNPEFIDGGSHIALFTKPVPRKKDTTLVDFEQPKLDIWVWDEDYIQPVQNVRRQRDLDASYIAQMDTDGGEILQIADDITDVYMYDGYGDLILASSDKPYRVQQSWDIDAFRDYYIIDRKDGSKKMVMQEARLNGFSLSPDGKYCVYYDPEKCIWFLYTVETGETRDLTSNLGVNFYDEDHDTPSLPGPAGYPVWEKNSAFVLIRDRFDYWQFDPKGVKEPFMLTKGVGRENNRVYGIVDPSRWERFNNSLKTRPTAVEAGKPVYFTTLNKTSKMTGFAIIDLSRRKPELQQLVEGPYSYRELSLVEAPAGSKAAKNAKFPTFVFQKGNFEEGNDLWMTNDNFKTETRLTESNPQIKDYNWGTVELVNWDTEDGIRAEGLLFKPENFDPSKKYPVMIYFYEKYSDELYVPRAPAPSASTVNIPYFVSNGYICFIPDIYYTDGHPGKSCMRSLMPACDMLCKYDWIDGDNMAIQGQSWGGYQVAYIITQTNRFKAAGAGAPVSNMTSAYGGIRWESGMARTFQYEHSQSRIGQDLWSGFDLYIENSPLFFVPNVSTPVLIMHNDADGAVPWWQGIEFYNALRRCRKPAWLLQYNDEAHNLRERRNRKDLSIRLSQFFDHYLKGAPAPIWMTKGVPATLKGIDLGYGYDQEEDEQQ